MFCQGAENNQHDCTSCASISEKDSRIIRAIHALSDEDQRAIETLLHIDA